MAALRTSLLTSLLNSSLSEDLCSIERFLSDYGYIKLTSFVSHNLDNHHNHDNQQRLPFFRSSVPPHFSLLLFGLLLPLMQGHRHRHRHRHRHICSIIVNQHHLYPSPSSLTQNDKTQITIERVVLLAPCNLPSRLEVQIFLSFLSFLRHASVSSTYPMS